MGNKTKYDVIIIGAGPAGLMVGRELSKKGLSYIIFDKKKIVGEPLRCGEGIRRDGFEELFGKEDYDFIKNRTIGCEVSNGKFTKQISNFNYVMLDRPAFEKWLAEPIIEDIELNTVVDDVDVRGNGVFVKTKNDTYKSKLVVLANGTNFNIQKKYNLIEKDPVLIPCIGGIFKNYNKNPNNLYFLIDEKAGGALWIFPKDDQYANVGLGISPFAKNRNMREVFDQMVESYGLSMEGRCTFGGTYVTSGPIEKTYSDRMLVCGDAAGLVYAGAGEGIYFALKSGKHAAKTIIENIKDERFDEESLKDYEKSWKNDFGKTIEGSLVAACLIALGINYRKVGFHLRTGSEESLRNTFLKGELSFRIRLIYKILKYLNPVILREKYMKELYAAVKDKINY